MAILKLLKNSSKLGVDINIVNDRGFGALYFAARHNKLETVKFLVSCGAKLDLICEADGTTPLMEAAQLGNDSIVRFLIESGADIKSTRF